MHGKRPVFLNLTKIKFPLTALLSISHRISGVIIFFCLPFLLYALQESTSSLADFSVLASYLDNTMIKVCVWLAGCAFIYHVFAGLKHLVADFFGIGLELVSAFRAGVLLIIFSLAGFVVWGMYLW